MAIILAQSDPNDGALVTSTWRHEGGQTNANPDFEDDARRGDGATTDPGNAPETGQRIPIGGQKWNNGDQTSRYQGFLQFAPGGGFVLPANSGQIEVVTASIRVARNGLQYDAGSSDATFGKSDAMQFWTRDWSPPLSGSAWMDMMPIAGQGTNGNFQPEAELSRYLEDRTTFGNLYEAGGELFLDKVVEKLAAGQAISYTVTVWTEIQGYPKVASWLSWIVSKNDTDVFVRRFPTLQVKTQRVHALNGIGGASIQMTDGTAVFLRYDTATKRYNLYYQRVNSATPVLIDFLRGKVGATDNSGGATQFFGQEPGFQSFSLTRDDSNNLYITGPRGNQQLGVYGNKVFNACSYRYDGNYTWTRFTQTQMGDIPGDDVDVHRGYPNNTQAVWLPGGTSPTGRLVVPHSRRDGQWARNQLGVSVLDAGWTRGTSSTRVHKSAHYGDENAPATWWRPPNSTGTMLDAFRDGSTIRMASAISALPGEDIDRSAGLTCSVDATNQPGKPSVVTSTVQTATPHDPDAKIRALWMGDSSPYWAVVRAGHIQVINKSDGSVFRNVDLPAWGIAGFPSRADLQKSQAWDAVWDSGDPNRIWIYYRNALNPRVISKFRYNYATNATSTPFDFTPDPIGPSGSEIVAIRVPRQQVDARCVLVDVAMQNGAGTPEALITLRDTTMNRTPGTPILDTIASFNAASSKTFDWLFVDDNSSDFATAQDIEIRNVTTGANVHSASHVAATLVGAGTRKYRYSLPGSTLTNDASYQIRVRAYDSVDFPSEWSEWVQFSTTTTGGYVEITEPAEDNQLLNQSSVTVKWTYTNTTVGRVQTGYRVRVLNNQTGVTVYDSNLIASTATQHILTGLASDIEYRVEVTIRDSTSQMSGAGIRLITPDFNNPSLPQIVAVTQPGYIEIRVTNPPPTGENPVTVKNQIARKEATEPEEAYVVIGECPPNGVYQDWTVASGVLYTYKARGSSE